MLRTLGWVLALALVVYVLRGVFTDFDTLLGRRWEFRWWLLCLSLAGIVVHFGLCALLWTRLLNMLGAPLDKRSGLSIWALSQLGRYAPGMVWMPATRAYLLGRRGIGFGTALLSAFLEFALVCATALLLSALLLSATRGPASGTSLKWLWLLAVPALFVVHPRAVRWMMRTSRQVRRGVEASDVSSLYSRYPVSIVLGYGGVWILFGFWFATFVASTYSVPLTAWPSLAAAIVTAWLLGFLAIFIPSGLGVREASLMILLQPVIPADAAAAIALAARVWLTAGEMVFLGLVVIGARRGSPRE